METPARHEIDAVLVLAGGDGRRLGGPKAWLDWRGQPLLRHVLDALSMLGPRPFVAARAGQPLPAGSYTRVDDPLQGAGPLAGLAAGLTAIQGEVPAARVAVCGCDYPFVDPRLYRALAAGWHAPIVLPRWAGHEHPLQAVWSATLSAPCAAALAAGERRVRAVVGSVRAVVVDAERLVGIDAERALLNLNDPGDWSRARFLDA